MGVNYGKIKLNSAQKVAVNQIDGPVLVIAGPGTGKTQLLSARIANILEQTDALPQNILCLTFTEAAAQNMRQRLSQIIKDNAYDVHINTYHGFGSDIIRSYPEFFEEIDLETGKDTRLERPIDDLQRIQIVSEIINKLPYSSPLISARNYIKNVASTISELKRGLYTPDKLIELSEQNLQQVRDLSPKISDTLKEIKTFPRKADQSIRLFETIAEILKDKDGLAKHAYTDLENALQEAEDTNKSKPLTAWKNKWLTKDEDDQFQFTDEAQHLRIIELAKVYENYQKELEQSQLYDFDDMILRTINAIKTKDDLRYNLQEKYQYILLDEFQDTNTAQFELVRLLGDNPVNEGRPNIFAVGDDDQAIYAFQGAEVSNMLGFISAFRDVKVINLTENYRSHPDILHVAHNIANQIETRLHNNLDGVEKALVASSNKLPKNSMMERHEFDSQANELAWVSDQIAKLVDSGVSPDEIAILAPKHKYLEQIVPFLNSHNIPLSYEKREDILQTNLIKIYQTIITLIIAIRDNNSALASQLFPQVLSFDFYQIPVKNIWQINWQHAKREETRSWAEIALEDPTLEPHVTFYLKLGSVGDLLPLENTLDLVTGSDSLRIDSDNSYTSPLKNFYFDNPDKNTLDYYESLANLSTIREHLRAYQAGQDKLLKVDDFITFINAYQEAEQPLINTHPIAQSEKSVQLMTAYKAKGLEFEYVFLLSVHDDVWGKKARSGANKISLPTNLQHVRYMGSGEDELRRLLFVAITRAKHGLYLTSHAMKDSGKSTEPVKYLMEFTEEDERKTTVLPEPKQTVKHTNFSANENMQNIELLWESRHLDLNAQLSSLLKERLDRYQMSPTHLNSFIDIEYGGPETFLLYTILRFPMAPGEDGEFGNAIHMTLEWYQKQINEGKKPTQSEYLSEFNKQISNRYITPNNLPDYKDRGRRALKAYIDSRQSDLNIQAKTEVDFRKEGVLVGDAHLTGKIDRLEIDEASKSVRIVDFKTGKPHEKWEKSTKLLKYEQQLYFYKFLIEGSHSYKNYKVAEARLEFVEPTASGKIMPPLTIKFDDKKEKEMKKLIQTVWNKIKNLDLPDTSQYDPTYKSTQDFINGLIN